MSLFEIETSGHIMLVVSDSAAAAQQICQENYPEEEVLRIRQHPRPAWVVSKSALRLNSRNTLCDTARQCLAQACGDRVQAIRLFMKATGHDLEVSRHTIDTNMAIGW